MKKGLRILTIVFVALIAIFIAYLVLVFIGIRTGYIVKWDNRWYTKNQLEKAFPPQYIDVPAKNTPEEVYKKFREALLNDDIESALGEMSEYRKNEYREAFKDEEKLKEWVKKLPEEITRKDEYGNFSSYYYNNFIDKNDPTTHPISFSKNSYGYWQIDQI